MYFEKNTLPESGETIPKCLFDEKSWEKLLQQQERLIWRISSL
jgi:hypothetical protein